MVRALVLPMVVVAAVAGWAVRGAAQSSSGQASSSGRTRTQSQTSNTQSSSLPGSSSATTVDAFELTGHVINARTNAPIPRALVKFGGRAVLTNHDGVFSFPQVTTSSGTLAPSKQGFYGSPAGDLDVRTPVTFTPGSPLDLLLYPEAVITGVVANASGEGLPNFLVTLRKSTFDENGHRWQQAGAVRTDSTGAYRQVVPPGDYSVQARTFSRTRGDGEMYLPVSVPADSTSTREALHVKMGDQVPVNLRPEARKGYVVSIASDADGGRGFPRITAYNASGLAIPLTPVPDRGDPGAFRVVLPNGTYRLSATLQSRDGIGEGEAQVTVAGRDVEGVVLHYNQTPRLPVEISVDPGVSMDNLTMPLARSLGLVLVSKVGDGDGFEQTYTITTGQDKVDGFAVPHGVYRFQIRGSGAWYATSADYGGSNLLTDDLVIGLGAGGQAIRLRISNQTGGVQGTVTVDGQPAGAYVYLIATMPSGHPVIMIGANRDGSFGRDSLQPGSYRVLATQQRMTMDLRDPAVLTRFQGKMETVTVDPAVKQTLALEALPSKEMPQ